MARPKKEVKSELVPASDVLLPSKGDDFYITGEQFRSEKVQIIPIAPSLNFALGGGISEGSWVITSGVPKAGKAQPLNAKVYTPSGPKTIKDLVPGDIICNTYGTKSIIKNVFDQGIKDIYAVTFADGDVVHCCDDHLWLVKYRHRVRKRHGKLPPTYHGSIKQHIVLPISKIKQKLFIAPSKPKWAVDLPSPVYFDSQPVDIDPYLLGLLIGDGSFSGGSITFTNVDIEILNSIQLILDKNNQTEHYSLKPNTLHKKTITYRIINTNPINKYKNIIKNYGLLNLKSKDKFIPKIFIYNSVEVRLSILQGLLDTDGTVTNKGCAEYSTVSYQLACDFKEIVQSLGMICIIKTRYTSCNGKKFKSYRCSVKANDHKILFRLSRKVEKAKIRTKPPISRKIIKVELVGQEICKCIEVDANNGLYITDHFIPTHNTTTALHCAANAQKPEFGNRPIYYIDAEGRIKDLNISGIAGLDLTRFFIVRSSPGKILSAEDLLNEGVKILTENPECMLIIDSASALCAQKEMIGEIKADGRVSGPKLLAQFCRKMGNVVPINKCIVWVIQHLIANTSGYGIPLMEDGGNKIAYQADFKMRCKSFHPWIGASEEAVIGQIIDWQVVTSGLGGIPGYKTQSYFRYGLGLDVVMELIELAIKINIIKKAGAWFEFDGQKHHGQPKLWDFLSENKDVQKELGRQVNEALGMAVYI